MESLSNKAKLWFIHENNKFRSYRKDQRGNKYWQCTMSRCTARLKTFTFGKVVELISYHTHADTVQIEPVQILRTVCKRKATKLHVNVRPQLFCQGKPNLISSWMYVVHYIIWKLRYIERENLVVFYFQIHAFL